MCVAPANASDLPITLTISIGAIGYGYWGPNVVRNLAELPDCRLSTACDLDADRLKQLKRRYPDISTTTSVDEVLQDRSIQAIYLATPVSTHFELASRALEAGKHVLVEKPLASSAEQAERLCELAEKTGQVLMVGHTFVYSPPVVRIKEVLTAGTVGDLHYLDCARVNLGLFQKDVSVLWDLIPHDLSILLYWLGRAPVLVSAHGRSLLGDRLEDVAFVNLEFADGVLAQLHVSWLAPVKLRRMTIVGSKLMVLYDDVEPVEKVKLFDRGVDKVHNPETFGEFQLTYRTGDITSPKIDATEPLLLECQDFLECIRTGRKPRSDGRFGLAIVRVIEAAERSMRNRGTAQEVAA